MRENIQRFKPVMILRADPMKQNVFQMVTKRPKQLNRHLSLITEVINLQHYVSV